MIFYFVLVLTGYHPLLNKQENLYTIKYMLQ